MPDRRVTQPCKTRDALDRRDQVRHGEAQDRARATGQRGPHRSALHYAPIAPIWRAIRRCLFEPCATADRGKPWSDTQ